MLGDRLSPAVSRAWIESLPALIEQVREEFGLEFSPPLPGGSVSWVAPARLPSGERAVVKIGWPHPEIYGEPAALRAWDGRAAVRLIADDPRRHALILELCEPGERLADAGLPADDRLRIGCGILRELWTAEITGPGIEPLGAVTAEWSKLVRERMERVQPPYDPGLVRLGADLLAELPAATPRRVLLHGDFHPGNVLSSRRGWLAIDPKPMAGDPGYDPWPLLKQIDDPTGRPAVLAQRIALLGDELSLEPQRIVWWAVARRVETALWLAHHGDVPGGAAVMREVRTLADLPDPG